jgi:hypothetical protein
MPEFTTVSVQEAQLRTIPGRQGRYLNEYIDYIQQLPPGQAGRLRTEESEKPLTVRRRLEEQTRNKRRYTRRMRLQERVPPPDQPVDELGMVEQGIPAEESPE